MSRILPLGKSQITHRGVDETACLISQQDTRLFLHALTGLAFSGEREHVLVQREICHALPLPRILTASWVPLLSSRIAEAAIFFLFFPSLRFRGDLRADNYQIAYNSYMEEIQAGRPKKS
jgi:hypothetical protein